MKSLNQFSTRLKLGVGALLGLSACWLLARGEVLPAVQQAVVAIKTPPPAVAAPHARPAAPTAVMLQTDGGFALRQTALAGGGGASSGGAFQAQGTSGQSLTGASSGGAYELHSGFWPDAISGSGCAFAVAPTPQSFASNGGNGRVNVATAAGCAWTARSNNAWITITSGSSGAGAGTVNFAVAVNPGAARAGTLVVGDYAVTINQSGAARAGRLVVDDHAVTINQSGQSGGACAYSLAPSSDSLPAFGGMGNIEVQATGPGCAWTATSQASWITITAGSSGFGNGAIAYAVPPNPDNNPRTGTLVIAGQTFTLTQATASCLALIAPTSQSFAANGGVGSISLPFGADCAWDAFTNDPWITFSSAINGSGPATITYAVAAHTAQTRRAGTIWINGQQFAVLQGAQFNDVPLDHPFHTLIGKLSARGVTLGCDGGNFCPEAAVTRAQMAAFIIRALREPGYLPPPPVLPRFADVPSTNEFYAHIEELSVRQIALGCGGGNYCPDNEVTHEQMAAFLIRARRPPGYVPAAPATQRFADVPLTSPFAGHIEELAARGITLGCGGGNYCPASNVTQAQMAAFLVRAFGL